MSGRWRDCRTQAELDAALAAGDHARLLEGRFTVTDTGSSSVVAWGSSRVEARESSRVEARESSRVVARGSSSVEAWESSSVVARESSRVEAWGSSRVVAWESSSVVAWESSSVEARGSSRVEARGSSSVEARGSSSVEAWESSRVVARGSSSVEARGSSSVEARGSSSVEASPYAAVQIRGGHCTVTGGVQIRPPDLTTAEGWLEYHGITPTKTGRVTLYKGVGADFRSERGADYTPGRKPAADDWDPEPVCGGGLHLSPSPRHTHNYCTPARYVACTVLVAELVPIGDRWDSDKVKVPRVLRCVEVDADGKRVAR